MRLFGRKKETPVDREIRSVMITGASGMLGATLTRLLLSKGIRVAAVVRPGSAKRENLPEGAEGLTILEADLSDLKKLKFDGKIDAFFHFAWAGAFGEARNDTALQEANVDATLQAVKKAASFGAKVFVGSGSQAEFGLVDARLNDKTCCHPVTEYGRCKAKAYVLGAALAGTLKTDFVWTRILSLYGPYDNPYTLVSSAVDAFLRGGRFACTPGEQIWDYLYSEDAAAIFYGLARFGRHGEAYIVGNGTERPLKEYITDIRDAVDPALPIGFGERPYNENQVMRLTCDMTKTNAVTGRTERTPFFEGIQKTVAWRKEKTEKRHE